MDSYLTLLSAEDDQQLAEISRRFFLGPWSTPSIAPVLITSTMDCPDRLCQVVDYRCRLRLEGRIARVDFVGHAKLATRNEYGFRFSNEGKLVLGERGADAVGLELLAALRFSCRPDVVVRLILCDGHRFSEGFLRACLAELRKFSPRATLLYTPQGANAVHFGSGGFLATERLELVKASGAAVPVV